MLSIIMIIGIASVSIVLGNKYIYSNRKGLYDV